MFYCTWTPNRIITFGIQKVSENDSQFTFPLERDSWIHTWICSVMPRVSNTKSRKIDKTREDAEHSNRTKDILLYSLWHGGTHEEIVERTLIYSYMRWWFKWISNCKIHNKSSSVNFRKILTTNRFTVWILPCITNWSRNRIHRSRSPTLDREDERYTPEKHRMETNDNGNNRKAS